MLHLQSFSTPLTALVLFFMCVIAIFVVGMAIISRATQAARRWERRRVIEAQMRQAAQDADDQQRIARKLLGERSA